MAEPDLRAAIGAVLTDAGWPYRDAEPPLGIGTSTFHDGRLVGGSIQPMESIGMVRVIAFGEATNPGERSTEFHHLCGLVNSILIDTTLELDANLQMPVARASVTLTDDVAKDAEAVLAALGRVTSTFVRCVSGVLAVIDDGLSAGEAYSRIRGGN